MYVRPPYRFHSKAFLAWHESPVSVTRPPQEPFLQLDTALAAPHLTALALCPGFSPTCPSNSSSSIAQLPSHLSRLKLPQHHVCEHVRAWIPLHFALSPLRGLLYCLLTATVIECSVSLPMFLLSDKFSETIIFPLITALAVPHGFWCITIPLTQRFGGLFLFFMCFIVCWFLANGNLFNSYIATDF